MGILNKIKRIWYLWRNGDPVRKCPVFREEGCSHVDGMLCNFPECNTYHEYMGHEWCSCGVCTFFQECCSKQFGLGCYKGKNIYKNKQL